jgi:hypothetical protein
MRGREPAAGWTGEHERTNEMGWSTCHAWKSKDDVLREVFGIVNKGDEKTMGERHYRALDRRDGPECVWFLLELNGKPTIIVCRVAKHGGEWGEGGAWGEESGPYERGCPVEWLDRVPPPEGEYVADFRARVRAEHAAKLQSAERVRSIQAGDSVMLAEGCTPRGPFQVRTPPTKAGSCSATGPDGRMFKLTRRLLARAEICPPGTGAGNPHE